MSIDPLKPVSMSALGQKADICNANRHVHFSPNSDRESELPQAVGSALPPKRTCAVQEPMSALGQKRTLGRLQTNTTTGGRITLISVNSPGCVSTSIEPPCCLTMMSWLMERPRPVP